MAITPPPTPPNTGNPAQLEERADAFFGWFPTFVTDFNNELALMRGKTWATRSGSANAIVLTAGLVSLTVGTQVRFQAGASNTGAATINLDGLGAVACRTIIGVALPAGYIRTDVETVATYDGSFWVLDRQIERGSNANGDFLRFADGAQICTGAVSVGTSSVALGSMFESEAVTWAFPAAYSTTPYVLSAANNSRRWGSSSDASTTSVPVRVISAINVSGVLNAYLVAIGRWY